MNAWYVTHNGNDPGKCGKIRQITISLHADVQMTPNIQIQLRENGWRYRHPLHSPEPREQEGWRGIDWDSVKVLTVKDVGCQVLDPEILQSSVYSHRVMLRSVIWSFSEKRAFIDIERHRFVNSKLKTYGFSRLIILAPSPIAHRKRSAQHQSKWHYYENQNARLLPTFCNACNSLRSSRVSDRVMLPSTKHHSVLERPL